MIFNISQFFPLVTSPTCFLPVPEVNVTFRRRIREDSSLRNSRFTYLWCIFLLFKDCLFFALLVHLGNTGAFLNPTHGNYFSANPLIAEQDASSCIHNNTKRIKVFSKKRFMMCYAISNGIKQGCTNYFIFDW